MQTIDAAGVLTILKGIAKAMEEKKAHLGDLDQVIGDGDLGITMSKGFAGAAADAEKFTETDPGKVLMKAGMAINKHAPSTMGTIMATGFMRGGKTTAGKEQLTSADLVVFFQAFLDGVIERGKSKPGNKTVIDAIVPALEAAKQATDLPLSDAMDKIVAGAEKGVEDSKALMSQHGKAAVFREKSIGLADPGCVAFSVMVRGFADAVRGH